MLLLTYKCKFAFDIDFLVRKWDTSRQYLSTFNMLSRSRQLLYDSYVSSSRPLRDLIARFTKAEPTSTNVTHAAASSRRRDVADFLHSSVSKNGARIIHAVHSTTAAPYASYEFKRNVTSLLREAKTHSAGPIALICFELMIEAVTSRQERQQHPSSTGDADTATRRPSKWLREIPQHWVLDAQASASNPKDARDIDVAIRRLYGLVHGGAHSSGSDADALVATPSPGGALQVAPGIDALTHLAQRSRGDIVPNDSFQRYFLKQHLVDQPSSIMTLVRALSTPPLAVVRAHASSPLGGIASAVLNRMHTVGVVAPPRLPSHAHPRDAFVVLKNPAPTDGETTRNAAVAHATVRGLIEHKVCSIQSASSMLPALLLDAQFGESVLDLCAAPGSKTMVVIDSLATQLQQATVATRIGFHSSVVCANDASLERAAALNDRIGGTEPHVVVLSSQNGDADETQPSERQQRFDKVLVDAPCSGEGQMHRRPAEWRLWHPLRGVEFHKQQVALLRRAAHATNVGGLVVYSTCTLNPLENEAVVAAVVHEGFFEPVDVMRGGPLDRAPSRGSAMVSGMQEWSVPSPSGGFVDSSSDSMDLPATVFAQYSTAAQRARVAACARRVFPDLCGTKGQGEDAPMEAFFLIALRRVDERASSPSLLAAPTSKPATGRIGSRSPAVHHSSGDLASRSGFRVVSCASQLDLLRPVAPFFSAYAEASRRDVFGDSLDTLRKALTRAQQELGIRFLQNVRDGSLHIATDAAVALLSHTNFGSGAMALSCGARVLDGSGRLTEVGAQTLLFRLGLYSSQSSAAPPRQVFQLPLRDAQMLLSGAGTLTVPLTDVPHATDNPFAASIATVRNHHPNARGVSAEDLASSWRLQLVQHPSRFQDGNAIAVVKLFGGTAAAQNHGATDWALPVTLRKCVVEGTPSLELKCNLTNAAARRASGLIGTLHRTQRSFSSIRESATRRREGAELMAQPNTTSPLLAAVNSGSVALGVEEHRQQQSLEEVARRLAKEHDTVRI